MLTLNRRTLLFGFASSLAAAEDIRAILVNRVDEAAKAVGIITGTIDSDGSKIVCYGKVAKDRPAAPGGDTVYEIGSITKVFTSIILADMIERGEVKPDDPVASFLPEGVKVPSRNGRRITLLDLSMQVSGLPRMPNNFSPADFANPYADYDAARLYAYLSGYTLPREPGEKYEYSNIGAGLLGHALSRRAGCRYEELVRKRVLEPLRMASTSITLSPDQRKRLAPGYDAKLQPVKNWDLNVLEGAGALRSTAADMLAFLAANMELARTPLQAAMRRARSVTRPTGAAPDLDIAMGWHIWKKHGGTIVWHNGGTAGYRSWAGFDPDRRTGAVVLTNTSFPVDDIGLHLVNSAYPLARIAS